MATQGGSTFLGQVTAGNSLQIGNIAGNAYLGHSQNLKKDFFHWLPSIDFTSDQHTTFKKRYKQTGGWITQKKEFGEWLQNPTSSLLWCWGQPGIGKSVIASVVIDYLQKEIQTDHTGIVYAYFKHDSHEQQKPVAIIASLIKQLCCKMDVIPDYLLDFFREFDTNLQVPLFSRYISEFQCLTAEFKEVFIVIDALDECDVNQRKDIIEFLTDIMQRSNHTKIFVTSRKENDIEIHFNNLQTPIIPVEAKDVGYDIETFVRGRVEELVRRKELRIESKQLRDQVESTLIQKAEGMFLWVNLQLDRLCKKRREKDIEAELQQGLPPGLHATYQRIVENIHRYEPELQLLAQRSLIWVCYAIRPLNREEFLEAVSIEENSSSKQDLEKSKWDEQSVLEACANLLVFEASIVRPIHFSVHEYFTSTYSGSSHSILRYTSDKDFAFSYLSKCCLQYLVLETLQEQCKDSLTLEYRLADNPLAAHSAFFFDEYFMRCHVRPSDHFKCLRIFLDNECLSSTLQLRRSRGLNDWDVVEASFAYSKIPATPTDILYGTALYQVAEFIYTNGEWRKMKPPRFALHRAAMAGTTDAVIKLLDLGHTTEELDDDGVTPLYYASECGMLQACKILLSHGGKIETEGGYYGNALQAASYGGHENVVKLLLDQGADVHAHSQDRFYSNALQAASYRGHENVVKLLLDQGADVHAQGGEYSNALQAASYRGHENVVKLLLDQGADVHAQGGYYGNALQAASLGGNENVVNLLLDQGADVHAQGGEYGNALQAASYGGNENVVKLLLDQGADVHAQGGEYGNALQAASYEDNENVVKLLLDQGADVHAQGGEYGNALQAASYEGNENVVKLLLDQGADVHAQGGYYGNALQAASLEGHENVVELLLDQGADVHAQGGYYGNALQAASYEGHENVVKLLLDQGADIHAQGGEYSNALQAASLGGNEDVVKLLLDQGADQGAVD